MLCGIYSLHPHHPKRRRLRKVTAREHFGSGGIAIGGCIKNRRLFVPNVARRLVFDKHFALP